MQTISQLIVALLEIFPKEWGTVEKIHQTNDSRFLLIFEGRPWNWGASWSIAQGLSMFVRPGTIQLICQDGAWGYIDTSALRSYPVREIREETALKFLQDLRIGPGEYCSTINPDKPLLLCGVEDKKLIEEARKLWEKMPLESVQSGLFRSRDNRKMNAFLELEIDRASAIVKNLIERMDTNSVQAAALVCCGNLPALICDILDNLNISYAKIIPNEVAADNREDYIRLSQGGRSILEDLLSKAPNDPVMPSDGDWEKFRVNQIYDLETKLEQGAEIQQVIPDLKAVFSSPKFRHLSLNEKRKVIGQFTPMSFSILKQMIPVAELEKILRADARYLDLEEALSHRVLEGDPEFEDSLSDLVSKVPDADLQKLLDSSLVTPGIKEALTRHIEKRKIIFAEIVEQLSNKEFENHPDFGQKMSQIMASLKQEEFRELIKYQCLTDKVKQILFKQFMIFYFKGLIEFLIKKFIKPVVLGLGLLGLVCGLISIFFGFATAMRWYPLLITGFFLVEAVYYYAVKRNRMAE